MSHIRFIREPGFTYDVFFLFILYFNKDYCMSNTINYNKSTQDTEYYNTLLAALGDIPEELELFFRLKEDEKCLMTKVFFTPFSASFTSSYDLALVHDALTALPQLTAAVIDFYFPDKTAYRYTPPSITQISEWIRESAYSPGIKSSLYAFFIEPALVVQRLSQELSSKAMLAARIHEKNTKRLTEQERLFDLEGLEKRLRRIKQYQTDISTFTDVYVTFCQLHKNCIYCEFYKDRLLLMLGHDYQDMADNLCRRKQMPELDIVCGALAEKNRIRILDYLEQREESTIQAVEQALGFTGTNAYYHLAIMLKANILRSRSKGRTILYSLNRSMFNDVIDLLDKYRQKETAPDKQ